MLDVLVRYVIGIAVLMAFAVFCVLFGCAGLCDCFAFCCFVVVLNLCWLLLFVLLMC